MKSDNNSPHITKILLASSRSDPAGSLIHEEVMRILDKQPELSDRYLHRQFDERLIYIDGPSFNITADLIIFLSRHASVDPRPVLTVHVTGNFGTADFGGEPGCITPAATAMMHALLNRLAKESPDGFEVSYEATHHGPTGLSIPSCFIELGSTATEWNDRNAAAAVARAVIGAEEREDIIKIAGFGGTHYAKRQTEITLTTRGGFGHIMPTRDLDYLDERMFSDIIHSSSAEAVYIDKKSVPKETIRLVTGMAKEHSLPVISQSDIIGMKSLPFTGYKKILALADQILPGASIDIHALNCTDDLTQFSIPADLIAEAEKVDTVALKEGLDTMQVVRLSGKGIALYHIFIGNRNGMSNSSHQLIHLCVSIIQKNCTSRIDGENLIIQKLKFDPVRAQKLGLSAGPEFGKLMRGERVTIDGRIITPEMVMNVAEKCIHIPGWAYDEINR